MRALVLLASLYLALALPVRAQDAATLVADRIEIRADTILIADGNVEVLWRGARLRARRIAYDRAADRLTIEGPITLTEGADVAIFADQAELSGDLQEGILTGARLVLAQQLQLAAVEIARVGGRYTELTKVVASSCQVCADNPVPLWSIRARRVVHDLETRQIHFEGAQFRVVGVPIIYLPRLRFPDPTLKRSNGFLFPRLRSTSELGTGLKLPYFLTLGRSADLTITPYLSRATRTVELRYRQAFRTGDIEFQGAASRDDILPGDTRYYVFGDGAFTLPRGYLLTFGLQAVSDDAYLLDYGYSGADRLESSLAVTRTRRDEHITARLLNFRTLRAGEVNSTQPSIVGDALFERRFAPGAIGGIATVSFGVLSAYRSSTLDVQGRDVARASAGLGWQRSEVFGPGILATATAQFSADAYDVRDDAAFPGQITRLIPEAGLTLRWPFARTIAGGVNHVVEPIAMLAWAPENPAAVPNEDSVLSELDESNLFSLSRYPGTDARERGLRLALGVGWTRYDPAGWSLGLTFGRIFRRTDHGDFGAGTGLDGQQSDWLAAVRFDLDNRLDFTARALFDDSMDVSKADLRVGYQSPRFNLDTGFLFLAAAPSENRLDETAEWAVDTNWRINAYWTGRANWRYDFDAGRATRAGIGFGWENECVRADLSLSRRFTSSTSVRPTTNFGLSVELTGFGTGGEGGAPRRSCLN